MKEKVSYLLQGIFIINNVSSSTSHKKMYDCLITGFYQSFFVAYLFMNHYLTKNTKNANIVKTQIFH